MDGLEHSSASCRVSLVEFCFDPKREQALDASELGATLEAGRFVWIDVEVVDPARAEQTLVELAVLNDEVIQDALFSEPARPAKLFDEKAANVSA